MNVYLFTKYLLFSGFGLLVIFSAPAQDTLITKNGEEKLILIDGITDSHLIYRLFDEQNDDTFHSISYSDVSYFSTSFTKAQMLTTRVASSPTPAESGETDPYYLYKRGGRDAISFYYAYRPARTGNPDRKSVFTACRAGPGVHLLFHHTQRS